MSDYVPVTHVNGETFNAGSANAWETRIDNAFTSHETTMSGLATTDTALDTRLDALEAIATAIPQNTAVADTYTFVASDIGKVVESQVNANAKTWTIPAGLGALGSVLEVFNRGTGTITIAAASGVSIVSPGSVVTLTQQFASARLRKRQTTGGSEVWVLSGNIG